MEIAKKSAIRIIFIWITLTHILYWLNFVYEFLASRIG
jgi:hypothetical protein